MQAVIIEETGDTSVLQIKEVPKPDFCGADEVLVKVMAAGVNPVDTKLRKNGLFFEHAFPAVLGCDGAGIVEKVGANVTHLQAGDAVYYCYGGLGNKTAGQTQSVGNYAEYAVVKAAYVALKPESLDFDTAAAAPLVLITAWEALFDRAQLQSGQKVFIHAGAGGVGHVAIQLAKLAGAEVATTVSSSEKAEFVSQLGADLIINYKQENVSEALLNWTDGQGVDIALDTVGGEALKQLVPAMRLYGNLVTLLQIPDEGLDWKTLRIKNVRISQTLMLTPMLGSIDELGGHHAAILEQCAQFFDERKLSVYVDDVLPLSAAGEAHRRIEDGHQSGKLVLQMHLEEEADAPTAGAAAEISDEKRGSGHIVVEQMDAAGLQSLGVFTWPTWTKEASVFPWTYKAQEVCYLLEGDVLVTPKGGQMVRFGAGDLVTFPEGMSCIWEILSDVKKHYIFK